MGGVIFDTSGQLGNTLEIRYDPDGTVWIQALAHAALTALTPYKVIANEYGWVTAATTTAVSGECYIGVAPAAGIASAAIGWLQIGGPVASMVTPSLSVSVGHALYISAAGAVADKGADYTGVAGEFAICYTASTTSTTQDVILVPKIYKDGITSNYVLKADDYQLLLSDSGKTFGMATDAKTFTLPAIAGSAGVTYTFVNTGADGNNLIDVDPTGTGSGIHGTITLAASVVVLDGTDGDYVRNTKATSTTGDSITLVSNGADWFVTASTGIWASQA